MGEAAKTRPQDGIPSGPAHDAESEIVKVIRRCSPDSTFVFSSRLKPGLRREPEGWEGEEGCRDVSTAGSEPTQSASAKHFTSVA